MKICSIQKKDSQNHHKLTNCVKDIGSWHLFFITPCTTEVLPPPCLMSDTVFLGLKASGLNIPKQAYLLRLWPNNSIIVSLTGKTPEVICPVRVGRCKFQLESVDFVAGFFFWNLLSSPWSKTHWTLALVLQHFPVHATVELLWFLGCSSTSKPISSQQNVTVWAFFQDLAKWWHVQITWSLYPGK